MQQRINRPLKNPVDLALACKDEKLGHYLRRAPLVPSGIAEEAAGSTSNMVMLKKKLAFNSFALSFLSSERWVLTYPCRFY